MSRDGVIERFMRRLEKLDFDPTWARRRLGKLRTGMAPDEVARALTLIGRREATRIVGEEKDTSLLDVTPPGWLRDWMTYLDNSESPRSFICLSGLAVLSFAVGRKVWRTLPGMERIYPPLSVFLLSPAGQARRGQAIKPAARIAREAGLTVLQDEATAEAIFDTLASMGEGPSALVIAEEASTMFGAKDYQKGMASLFCRLLDADDVVERRTKGKGLSRIEQGLVSCIFGAAPAWFSVMPPEVVLGGLLSRCLVAYETRQEQYIPFPLDGVDEEKIRRGWKRLVSGLREVVESDVIGNMAFTQPARRLYADFYRRTGEERARTNTRIATWLSRKPAHVLRVAMVFAVSSEGTVTVTEEMLDRAISLLDLFERKLRVAYEHAGLEKHSRKRQRILDAISTAGGIIGHSDLFRNVHGSFRDRDEFMREIDVLLDLGMIEKEVTKTIAGRRSIHYRVVRT